MSCGGFKRAARSLPLFLVLGGCAVVPAQSDTIQFTRLSGRSLQIVSARLVGARGAPAVAGVVHRPVLRRGPVWGQVDVTAVDTRGERLAQVVARWPGRLGGRSGGRSTYYAPLPGADPTDTSRVIVSYHASSDHHGEVQ